MQTQRAGTVGGGWLWEQRGKQRRVAAASAAGPLLTRSDAFCALTATSGLERNSAGFTFLVILLHSRNWRGKIKDLEGSVLSSAATRLPAAAGGGVPQSAAERGRAEGGRGGQQAEA